MIELNTMLAAYERALSNINTKFPLADAKRKQTLVVGAQEVAWMFCSTVAERLTLFERQHSIPETDKFLTLKLPFAKCMSAIRWSVFGPMEGYVQPSNMATRLPERSEECFIL